MVNICLYERSTLLQNMSQLTLRQLLSYHQEIAGGYFLALRIQKAPRRI